ncbi:DUF4440 domain-containing protein [Rhodococcus sp. IEGM 1354]|uniref:YybH family protein n=1 Tax=Rhodococcus sp. IEGM 1354 TaxID=3047088 RepID=UPI0024B65793|nr:DUF4440 domain-containing protein [Rhodococcus sp. IEGM 1354]MDI9933049.1 DUF4440 domain-containing protein [Rhodococcus sp. IEGM 1354]
MSSDHLSQIEDLNRGFGEAFSRGDGAGVASVYVDNAILLPPGGPTVHGRDEIASFWQGVIDAGGVAIELETVALDFFGDVAREIGRGDLTMASADGSTSKSGLKYVVFWMLTPNGWRYETDIWNAESDEQA